MNQHVEYNSSKVIRFKSYCLDTNKNATNKPTVLRGQQNWSVRRSSAWNKSASAMKQPCVWLASSLD